MKKSDLKTGMVVRYRDGAYRTVFKDTAFDCDFIAGDDLFNDLCHYDEDLFNDSHRDLDIMAIYSPISKTGIMHHELGKKIWTRSEKKQYTYAQLKEILGEEFEIVKE